MVDFKALVGSRPTLRPVANLNIARNIKLDFWNGYNPNNTSKGVASALSKVANAPVSTNWWENFKTDMFNLIQKPAVQFGLNTLDAARNAVFTQASNWADGDLKWNDLPMIGLAQGAVGSYTGNKVTTDDFFKKAGWENKEGWQSGWSGEALLDNARDVASFVGDVALDPLTYVTLGAGSAVKASATAAQQALKAGLKQGTKEFDDFVTNAAKAKANNQAIGLNIPFGPEVTLAQKPDFLKIKSQTVGAKPAADLANKMATLGLSNEQRYKLASSVLGRPVQSFKELNTQEWDYLNNLANRPDFEEQIKRIQASAPDPFAPSDKLPSRQLTDEEALDINNRAGLAGGYQPKMIEQLDTIFKPVLKGGKIVRPDGPLQFIDSGRQAEQQLKQLYEYAQKQGLPPGREYETLQELWTHIAPPDAGTLDDLIEAATKQAPLKIGRNRLNEMQRYGISPFQTVKVAEQVKRLVPDNGTPNFTFKNADGVSGLPAVIPQSSTVDGLLARLGEDLGKGFKYHEGADGMSALGKALKGNKLMESIGNLIGGKRYVAPSAQLADHRIKKGVDVIEDARLGGFAKARFKVDEMGKLAKLPEIKALTPEELELLPYVIEGKWPKSMDPSTIAPETMQKLDAAAAKLKEYRDTFTKEELDAGVGYTPRDNYFPHILDIPKDNEEFEALIATLREADPDLAMKLQNAPRGFTRQRKMFDSMADIRDFLDKHKDNPAIQEKFGNAVFNPLEAYARRAMSGAHEVAKMQSYRELEKMGVARKLKPGEHLPAGWKKIDIPGMEDSVVPAEVHKRMENLSKILTNDVSVNKVLNRAEQMYTIWRRNATVVGPGFHARQIIGNIFQNTLAGVTPKAYALAAKVLAGKGSVKIGGQELTADRIIKMAMEDGVIGTGSSTDFLTDLTKELGTRLDKGSILQRLNPLSEKFTPGQIGRKASELEDNLSRLAHYIFVLQKGGTRKIAKESVIKHLYDYSNLSGFERGVMRTVMPFYAWMRNNVPFQIMQAIKRPGLYQVIDDFQEALQQEPEVDPLLDEMGINREDHRQIMHGLVERNGGVLPEYIQDRYINVGGDNYFNVSLPSSDLSMLSHPMDNILQSLGPWFQYPMGLATNENSFGAPINPYGEDVDIPSGIRFTLDQLGGFPGRAAGMLLGNYIPSTVGPTSANEQDMWSQIGRLMGVTQVDPVKSLEGLLYERAREVDNEKKRQKALSGQ